MSKKNISITHKTYSHYLFSNSFPGTPVDISTTNSEDVVPIYDDWGSIYVLYIL